MIKAKVALCVVAVLFAAPVLAEDHGVEHLDQAWVQAVRANDLEAVMALYASDAVLYPPDVMSAEGSDAIREGWKQFLDAFEVQDAEYHGTYETQGNLSAGWGTWKLVVVPKAGGEPMTMEGRATAVAKKIGGEWKYIADHASVPLPPPPEGGG